MRFQIGMNCECMYCSVEGVEYTLVLLPIGDIFGPDYVHYTLCTNS